MLAYNILIKEGKKNMTCQKINKGCNCDFNLKSFMSGNYSGFVMHFL